MRYYLMYKDMFGNWVTWQDTEYRVYTFSSADFAREYSAHYWPDINFRVRKDKGARFLFGRVFVG